MKTQNKYIVRRSKLLFADFLRSVIENRTWLEIMGKSPVEIATYFYNHKYVGVLTIEETTEIVGSVLSEPDAIKIVKDFLQKHCN